MHQELPALPRVVEEGDCARKQAFCRGRVEARQCSQPCRSQMLGSPARQRPRQLIGQPELVAIAMCLLQVVADDLFVLKQPLSRDPFQPRRETSMEIGPLLLGE